MQFLFSTSYTVCKCSLRPFKHLRPTSSLFLIYHLYPQPYFHTQTYWPRPFQHCFRPSSSSRFLVQFIPSSIFSYHKVLLPRPFHPRTSRPSLIISFIPIALFSIHVTITRSIPPNKAHQIYHFFIVFMPFPCFFILYLPFPTMSL